jgi:hypothetical protein
MMDNFARILRRLPIGNASSSSEHFGGVAPFKVQVNFDIPLFEGQIDVDVVDKWLNLLEGYFSVHNFSNRENITFVLLKVVPHVKDWWETYCEQKVTRNLQYFRSHPLGIISGMLLRNNTTLLEDMMTSIPNGPHCDMKRTRQYQNSQISSIPCAPSWVSKTLNIIWFSSTATFCIDTSKHKWIF